MKAFVLAVSLALAVVARPAGAHDAYDDSESHPLRVVAYALHPVGWALEWLIARPLHFVVSEPATEPIFGHEAHENPFGNYRPYRQRYDAEDEPAPY